MDIFNTNFNLLLNFTKDKFRILKNVILDAFSLYKSFSTMFTNRFLGKGGGVKRENLEKDFIKRYENKVRFWRSARNCKFNNIFKKTKRKALNLL